MDYKTELDKLSINEIKQFIKDYNLHTKIIISGKKKDDLINEVLKHTELHNGKIYMKSEKVVNKLKLKTEAEPKLKAESKLKKKKVIDNTKEINKILEERKKKKEKKEVIKKDILKRDEYNEFLNTLEKRKKNKEARQKIFNVIMEEKKSEPKPEPEIDLMQQIAINAKLERMTLDELDKALNNIPSNMPNNIKNEIIRLINYNIEDKKNQIKLKEKKEKKKLLKSQKPKKVNTEEENQLILDSFKKMRIDELLNWKYDIENKQKTKNNKTYDLLLKLIKEKQKIINDQKDEGDLSEDLDKQDEIIKELYKIPLEELKDTYNKENERLNKLQPEEEKNNKFLLILLGQVIHEKEYDIIYNNYNKYSLEELEDIYIKMSDELPKIKTTENENIFWIYDIIKDVLSDRKNPTKFNSNYV